MKAHTTMSNSSPILDGNWLGDTKHLAKTKKASTGWWSMSCEACGTLLTANTWLDWLKIKSRQSCKTCVKLKTQQEMDI